MQKDADTFISNNERQFIKDALTLDCRVDGRTLYDYRKVNFEFFLDDSGATVTLGKTRVTAVISASLEAPFPDRPSEGNVRFNVECSPMASPAFEAGRPGATAIQLARLVERALKQSGAVDSEALCVIAGRKVWALRCDVHVLNHGGNLIDACVLAALAAFMVYRRPEVTVGGESGTEVIVHPKEQREPLPLTIHHTPLAVTWALYQGPNEESLCVVDPDLSEEAAQQGSATFIVNTAKEVCGTHKADGIGLTIAETMRLVRLSCTHVEQLMTILKAALQAHSVARVQARVRRSQVVPGLPKPSRHVTISGPAAQVAQDSGAGQLPGVDDMETSSGSDTDSSNSGSDEDESQDEQVDMNGAASGDETMAGGVLQQQSAANTSNTQGEQDAVMIDGPGKSRSATPQAASNIKSEPGASARAHTPSEGKAKISQPLLPAAAGRAATPGASGRQQHKAVSRASGDGMKKAGAGSGAEASGKATGKRVASPKLDDNLETIAALIAGRQPGEVSTENTDDKRSLLEGLQAAVKTEKVKKKKTKNP